ncbi:MAG: cupin domain-containing protein [Acidithiobacillus sp.]|nr:cupin domain-containing protein [Acidithiobacillus sp.]
MPPASLFTPRRRAAGYPKGSQPAENCTSGANVVGLRLRALRKEQKLSLRALAGMSGLSINTLSLIEHGRTSPSVNTLQQIAEQLQCPIAAFFEYSLEGKKVVYQQAGERPRVTFKHGTMEDLGAGMPRMGAEPLIFTMEPNADSGNSPSVHTGREFVYCIEGHILYLINNDAYLLSPGDSILFDAYLPHRWKNVDSMPSSALFVLCPMDAREHPSERHFMPE